MGKDSLFKKWCQKNWTATCKKIKLDYSFTPCTQINSKQIKDLNGRPKIIKLLEGITGSMLFDIGLSNIFLDMAPQARETKTKINKWDYIKLKSFCTVKEIINKMKKLFTEWVKKIVNDVSDKWLISKIYKELIHLNIKKTRKQPN